MTRPPGWIRLLLPLSWIYAAGSRLRAWCYKRGILKTRKLPGTVISVGNLTIGGTGKTPLVLWIAERLASERKHVAVLTRGYRGKTDASTRGIPQSDEVALLRARLSGKAQLGVGANRWKNGLALAKHGVAWFILDDGFQHLQLARDANIALLDATSPFGGGAVLPAGRLRESVSALKRADLIVVTRSVQSSAPATEAMIRRHTNCPIFYATTKLVSVLRVPSLEVVLPVEDALRARCIAFCGIGNPPAFFDDLRAWGFQIAGERSFPDHHVYSAKEAASLEDFAVGSGADALLCTEKDVWNLRHVQFTKIPVYCCRISFQLPENFWSAVLGVIQAKASGAQP